ncbi:hypothetical protein QR680_015333 [Steinernema hermaphroditum]|uniref:GIY-YIG domain-containing protein n=1 Tax=Steinernema hermaphroditum TaxID=289476 RepID=A0AA39H7B6_9BILA|nr:hypothetical protein QR680_015333 [Steinernema hermaphroditum]
MRRFEDPTNVAYNPVEFSACVRNFFFSVPILKIVSTQGEFLDKQQLERIKTFEVLLQDATCVLYPELQKKDEKKVGKRDNYRVYSGMRFYTYLLLDVNRLEDDVKKTSFKQFIHAVIYIGKGCGARPFHHIKSAKNKKKNSRKHKYLAGLDADGQGVIVADGGDRYSYCHEAFVREDCMMQLYPKTFLLNLEFDLYAEWAAEYERVLAGNSITADDTKKLEFGIYCLWRKTKLSSLRRIP